MISPTN